jgi:predicted SAM-dependent methyltransferase
MALRLNLGSGGAPRSGDGWVNIDVRPEANPDMVADLANPLPFDDESVDEIAAFDVLEHFSYHTAAATLGSWIKLLKPGGVIVIRTPDFDELCLMFVERRMEYLRAIQLMFGGQANEYDYHFIGINWAWLSGQLEWWGCSGIERLPDKDSWALKVRGVKAKRGGVVRNHTGGIATGVGR